MDQEAVERNLQPKIPGWGFALFLAVNAVSVWGGVFPFLPFEFQTVGVTLSFYTAQAGAALVAYALAAIGSFYNPDRTARALSWFAALPMVAGSIALLAAMYVGPAWSIALVVCAGILLGVGSTNMMLSWERAFAAMPGERGDALLVVGSGLSALIYLTLYLCPVAVTAYLVPLVFLPLCGAALTVTTRSVALNQSPLNDPPRHNPRVYRSFMHDYWRSSVAAGAVGFVAGITRAVGLADVTAAHVVNLTSMGGILASAAVILFLWRRCSFHLSMRKAFRWVFPALISTVAFIPFAGGTAYVDVFAGVVHMAYAFVQMILCVQCAQASRDRGLCPILTYSFCSGIMHVMNFAGFLCGWSTGLAEGLDLTRLALAALLAVWTLGISLYLVWMRRPTSSRRDPDAVQFIAFNQGSLRMQPQHHDATANTVFLYERADDDSPQLEIPIRPVLDRITKQCESLRLAYRLSDREAEVMELIVRGDTVARIAEKLNVSENTVRTHAKRIYTKLDVHSKQELHDLVQRFQPVDI